MPEYTTAETLKALEEQIEDACVRRDVAFLGTILSDDFTMLHGDGRLTPKTAWLDIISTGKESWVARELTDHVVDAHGDVALTTGRLIIQATAGRRYMLTYVRVYAYRNGRWQLLLHRTTEVHDL